MKPAPRGATPAVCLVTDRHAAGGRPLVEVVRAALQGGVDMVQVREKDLAGAALLALAREILAAARAAGGHTRVVINDRLDVALAAKAAGVHLPAEGLPIGAARPHVARKFLIGRSVHSLPEAQRAAREGADYLIAGPVFATPSKAAFGPPLGPAGLRKVAAAVDRPVWAIGGITPGSAAELRGIPIAGVAAITAIVAAADPTAAVAAIRAALGGPPAVPPSPPASAA